MTSLYGYFEYFNDSFIQSQLARLENERGRSFYPRQMPISSAHTTLSTWNSWLTQHQEWYFLLHMTNLLSFLETTTPKTPQTVCLPRHVSSSSVQDYYTIRKMIQHFWFPCHVDLHFIKQSFDIAGPFHHMNLFNIYHREISVTFQAPLSIHVDNIPVHDIIRFPDEGITFWILDCSVHDMVTLSSKDMFATS